MRIALLLVVLLPVAALAGTHPIQPGNRPGCFRNGVTSTTDRKGRAGFRRLDQLPPANEQLTVLRSIDGCQKPVIVRYGIGGIRR